MRDYDEVSGQATDLPVVESSFVSVVTKATHLTLRVRHPIT